jgi:hypothetical protein
MPTFYNDGISYTHLEAVTPSDTVAQPEFRAIFISGDPGLVKLTFHDGSSGSIYCNVGVIYPVRPKLIWDTGTDATTIGGLR